ncbi:hypothetical protein P3T37_001556 [Kitasatospora sp. MAA4]|uniref:hypothetical protein n=1 Tax=Kitasatospora sp. MAA4 TaxID=3035093 RepID=UPI002473A98A|nr:hypothetical protein [Kitasatospora sp. MAA4]MDH6132171.1 hypothetical protein [Kitasatospora sp. MAA4]
MTTPVPPRRSRRRLLALLAVPVLALAAFGYHEATSSTGAAAPVAIDPTPALPTSLDDFYGTCAEQVTTGYHGVTALSAAPPHPIAFYESIGGPSPVSGLVPQEADSPAAVQLIGCLDFSGTATTSLKDCSFNGNAAAEIAGTAPVGGALVDRVMAQSYQLTVYEAATGRKIGTVQLGLGTETYCPNSIITTNGIPERLYSTPTSAQVNAALTPFTG